MAQVTKVTLHYADGGEEELTDKIGYLVCHWLDKEEGQIQYTIGGLDISERVRMAGLLLDGFADDIEQRILDEEDQLALDQIRALRSVQEVLGN